MAIRSARPEVPQYSSGVNEFADSVWGRIDTIRDGARDEQWEAAWGYLIERYRPGLLALARHCLGRLGGAAVASRDAAELTDSFIARLPQGTAIDRAEPKKGSFRAWVHALLFRYARDWFERQRAAGRKPDRGDVASIDALEGFEPPDPSNEDVDLAWTRCLLRSALDRVSARSPRNAALLGTLLDGRPHADGDLALVLEVPAARIPLLRFKARKMLAEEVWTELKESVSSPQALDEERAALKPYLGDLLDPAKAGSFFAQAARPASEEKNR